MTGRVADEVAYSLRGRFSPAEVSRRVEDLLQRFDLAAYADANPFALSQGEKRRLSVATMAALDQTVLILDEPTFGQDAGTSEAMMTLLKSLQANGSAILLITHDMQLVADYADRVAVMDAGRIIFQGAPRVLFQRHDLLHQAGLQLPALAQLAQRLGYADVLTLDDWVASVERAAAAVDGRWQGASQAVGRPGTCHDSSELLRLANSSARLSSR